MAWKCPNCETLNQDPNCVICGAAKPAEDDVHTAQDDKDINNTETYAALKSNNRRKSKQALIVIIIGIISICVIGAVTALALSNINDRPVSSVTDLPQETSVPPETQPQSEAATEDTAIQTERNDTETAEETEPETERETKPETEKPSVIGEILSVSLNTKILNMEAGEKSTLYGTIKHTGSQIDNTVTWSSSNNKVAVVSNGTVTAVGPGKAVVSIFTVNGKTDTCTVQVSAAKATGISISAASVTLTKDAEYTLTATVFPVNSAGESLVWTTSDASVVVCDNGILKAVGVGRATVTVRTTNGKSASCAVTVTAEKITVSTVTLDESERTIKIGESFTLSAEVMPAGASESKVIWSSSDKKIAECIDGRVTARSVGETIITAKTANGKKAICRVTVTGIEAESVTLSDVKLMLNIGDIVTLTAFIIPEATTDKTLSWESGNTDIVSCDDKGKLTAKTAGTVYITVLTSNGKEAVCTVTVAENEIPVKSVTLNASTLTLEPGDLYTFTAAVSPEDATDTGLTWLTDNAGVVKIIGSDGAVIAVQEGIAVITVTSSNGKSASCRVTVKAAEPESNPESDFGYNISGGGAVIISYAGTSPSVIIPEKFGEYYVTAIGDSAFYNKTITSIKIPESVKYIGNFAFGYCTLLNNIIIPEGIEIIGDYAFAACAIRQLALPSTVGYIGEGAFGQCSNLATLTIAEANPYFAVLNGVLYDKDITKLICFPAGLINASALPVTLTQIGSSAFFGCFNLSTIVIPQNVTVIGNLAFAYCGSMTAVELPSGLISVGADAFAYCGSLAQIIIPSTLTRIEERTFIGCSNLVSAVLSANITFIADSAFTGCNSLVITCPAGSYAEQYAESKGIALNNGNP